LLKAALNGGGSVYSQSELGAIAAHCTDRENAARKVERLMRKVLAASMLSARVGQVFDGIITGAAPKGTYVRIFKPPVEGRVVRGERGIDVGDKVKVRLVSVDVMKGFIDFERTT
jgi:exoribonuclease-2